MTILPELVLLMFAHDATHTIHACAALTMAAVFTHLCSQLWIPYMQLLLKAINAFQEL